MAYTINREVHSTLNAAGVATDWISATKGPVEELGYILSSSSFSGSVGIQISIDGGTTPYYIEDGIYDDTDFLTVTSIANKIACRIPGALYRVYCISRTAGSITAIIFK